MANDTAERRTPGQVVALNDNEHFKNWFGQILGTLVVGGIVAMVLVYSDTNQNTRDISRHENLLSQQAENIQQILQDVAAIKAAVVR